MFIGHFGVGFAAKSIAKKVSLGTLFLAAQFIDLIWPILLIFGLERVEIDPGNTVVTPLNFIHYPFTHSLFGVLIWALLFGLVYFAIKRNLKHSIILGVLVLSHWFLDAIVHRPDLPLFPNSDTMFGFGLWNSLIGTIVVEGAIFAFGVYIYNRLTKPLNKKGLYGFWGLVIFLIVVYFSNFFGPPPPSAEPIAYVGLSQWLLIFWAYWIDKNRIYKNETS